MELLKMIGAGVMQVHDTLYGMVGNGLYIVMAVLLFVGIVAQWKLYEKANQPGWTCLVPVLNIIVFLRIVGRPANHAWFFLIPFYNIYFLVKVYIELCDSFGKSTLMDYILVILFNGFYILGLGLSYEDEYKGPVYGKTKEDGSKANVQLA
jgi:hypothetical protein